MAALWVLNPLSSWGWSGQRRSRFPGPRTKSLNSLLKQGREEEEEEDVVTTPTLEKAGLKLASRLPVFAMRLAAPQTVLSRPSR